MKILGRSLIIVIGVVFLAGCLTPAAEPEENGVVEINENTLVEIAEDVNLEIISNWLEHAHSSWDLRMRYPQGWDVQESAEDIKITSNECKIVIGKVQSGDSPTISDKVKRTIPHQPEL